ncbi:hypothetical protein GCM10027053_51230 [Intrasporangium mesophilum]
MENSQEPCGTSLELTHDRWEAGGSAVVDGMTPARPAPGASGSAGRGDLATQRSLAATRSAARDQADELLVHVPVLGDRAVQRLLDSWVEQAADTLRAISEAAEERLLDAGSVETGHGAAAPGTPPRGARR